MYFWFPIAEELLKHEEFIKSKPSDKLYYFALLHYVNLHDMAYEDDMYKSDIEFAAALSYSVDTIRNARRKFKKLGWIDYTNGFRTKKGKNVATTYHYVAWKETPEKNGEKRFVKFPHYDFEMMLNCLRNNAISHEEMIVYCYVVCFNQLYGTIGEPFFIPKKDLRKITNIKNAVDCIKQLANLYVFGDEAVLDYKDEYHRIVITELRRAALPHRDEINRKNFETYLLEVKSKAERMRVEQKEKAIQKATEKGIIIDPKQLVDVFKQLYKNEYGKKPDIPSYSKGVLIELAETNGVQEVYQALHKYFDMPDETIPNPNGAKSKTLNRFITNYDLITRY